MHCLPSNELSCDPHASVAVLHSDHANAEELVCLELVVDVFILLSVRENIKTNQPTSVSSPQLVVDGNYRPVAGVKTLSQ